MKEKNDARFTKEINDELQDGGSLQGLRDLVADKDNLIELCYRGNSGNKICIYYNNHKMFDIEQQKRGYKLTFNFNHARYKDDWQEDHKKLVDNYCFCELRAKPDGKGFNNIYCYFDRYAEDDWKNLYGIIKPIIDNFFAYDANETIDYIKSFIQGHEVKGKKRDYKEKIMQQQIFSANIDCNNGYFIYDMEFATPHKDTAAAKNDKNNNEPDMLAIKFENHKPVKLVFIEVKSNKKACTQTKSGAFAHIRKTAGALDEFFKTGKDKYVEIRKKDAKEIIKGYASIKLHDLNQEPDWELENIDVEILMVFTDEAVEWARKNVVDMKKAAAPYPEKLAFATVDAVDEKGKILPLLLDQQTKN